MNRVTLLHGKTQGYGNKVSPKFLGVYFIGAIRILWIDDKHDMNIFFVFNIFNLHVFSRTLVGG